MYNQYLAQPQPQPHVSICEEPEGDADVIVEEVVSLSPLARQGQQQQHRRVEATGDLLPIPGGFKLMPSTNVMEVQDRGENGLD